LWQALGLERPTIAWPWYAVIAGGINFVVSWLASVILDGFKKDWHQHSVPGQIKWFEDQGKDMKSGGWYVVPGKVEPVVWLLPIFFVCIIVFLMWFGTLG
jgi:SSS family solute:Na+ symporter